MTESQSSASSATNRSALPYCAFSRCSSATLSGPRAAATTWSPAARSCVMQVERLRKEARQDVASRPDDRFLRCRMQTCVQATEKVNCGFCAEWFTSSEPLMMVQMSAC